MPLLNEKTCLAACLALSLVCFSPLQAAENTSASIFKFQQTMALKGHASAQYKLAMMYETGDGVEKNLETARSWYKQAADQAYKPASHRLKYLDIAQTGTNADRIWLKELHRDAQSGDGEALLLLGQMYATGTGVVQELTLASRYLRKAAADNVPSSETELAQVEKTIEQKQATARAIEQQKAEADAKRAQQRAAAEQARIKRILRQKQLADEQSKRRQLALAEQQQLPQPKTATPAKVPTLADREVIAPSYTPVVVTEVDLSPCSGRNRFASTCR